MRLTLTAFVLVVVLTTSAAIGLAYWDRHGYRDSNVRAIHYDTHYDLSSQRRAGANP
jgi:hypothetical protein